MHDEQQQPRDAERLYRWAKGLFDATQAPAVESVAALEKMRVKQLKKLVVQHGIDCRSCAEKTEFVQAISKGLGLRDNQRSGNARKEEL